MDYQLIYTSKRTFKGLAFNLKHIQRAIINFGI
jgi:hypothetical protein